MSDLKLQMIRSYLTAEKKVLAETGSQRRRVQISDGESWLVRFLPDTYGDGKFFVRQAQHWFNKKAVTCPRLSGNGDAPCPVCDTAEEMHGNTKPEVADAGYKLKAVLNFVTAVICYAKDDGKHGVEQVSDDEFLDPYEFQLHKNAFEKLFTVWDRSANAKRPLGCLDLKEGKSFWATKIPKKGIDLVPEDAAPIFEVDANFDANVARIYAKIKPPIIRASSHDDLVVFARKAEDDAYEGGDKRRGPGRPAGRRFSDTDDAEDAPPARRVSAPAAPTPATASAPARRTASATPPSDSAAEEDETPPAPPTRTAAPPAPTPAARVAAPAPSRTPTPVSSLNRISTSAPVAASAVETTSAEEDPGIADEDRDAAEPAASPLPDEQAADAQESASEPAVAPPARTGNPRLMAKLAQATRTTRQ